MVDEGKKRIYEQKTHGIRDLVGVDDLILKWSNKTCTNGNIIFLDDSISQDWKLKYGWHHEVSHLFCESPIQEIWNWSYEYYPDGDRNTIDDEYNILGNAANTVIQVLEDERAESIYGNYYTGIGTFFKNNREHLCNVIYTPSTALLGMRCGMHNEVSEMFGDEWAGYCYNLLQDIHMADRDTLFKLADDYMDSSFEWYQKVIESDDEEHKKKVLQIEEREDLKTNIETDYVRPESTDDIEEKEIDPNELVPDEVKEDTQDTNIVYDNNILEMEPVGDMKGEIYQDEASRIIRELSHHYSVNREEISRVGDRIDISEYIYHKNSGRNDRQYFVRDFVDIGFNYFVLLDLSKSMKGERLDVCRNVGLTLYEVFDSLQRMGNQVDFTVAGFGGNRRHTMIQRASNISQCKRLDYHSNYPGTPTYAGIEYARRMLKFRDGDRNLILVTDGYPTGFSDVGKSLRATGQEADKMEEIGNFHAICLDVELNDEQLSIAYPSYSRYQDVSEVKDELFEDVMENVKDYVNTY